MADMRVERDTLGEVRVPRGAYWGAQTERAVANFPISGWRIPPALIHALGRIKAVAAEIHKQDGRIEPSVADAIVRASREVAEGKWDEHFPVDVFQTGSRTSSNMNANEVIANRAGELLGAPIGGKEPVHPNDHVNRGQSSNDVIPTAIHLAVRLEADRLLDALTALHETLAAKSEAFAGVVKSGRTHLQDAMPVTLGQEFSGYASQIDHGRQRIRAALPHLEELALGGTAVGTGNGAPAEFSDRAIADLAEETGIPFRPAPNRFEALAARDAVVAFMGAVNTVAGSLAKIANDLRLLSSGPRTGLAEITLPALQPGSSMMPGKINPVIPEMMIQVASHVMGAHLAVTIGGSQGPLELNIMMPMIAFNTLTAVGLLERAVRALDSKCVAGIEADEARCTALAQRSLALVTPLAERFGYDRAAAIAQRAWREGRTLRDIVVEEDLLSAAEAEEVLDPGRSI